MFSTRACSRLVASSTVLTSAGMVARPARWAARKRRSPAISSYSSAPTWRTRMGWRTPTALTESTSEERASSSKFVLGWNWLGRIWLSGTCRRADSLEMVVAWGMSAPKPRPRPLRRDTTDLLRQLAVGDGTARARIVDRDRLAKRRRLRYADGTGDDVLRHNLSEVSAHLGHN